MSEVKRNKPLFAAFLFILVIGLAAYYAIHDLAGSQSQQQQQSVSPIFGLIETELVEPLYIVKTLDKIGVYKNYFDQDMPNEDVLVKQLKYYSELFNLEFYVAHEKSRKQFNSDGRVFDLVEDDVVWYFTLKDEFDSEIQAVLGKREDVHLYIDVKQYDSNGDFIGFIGIGKSLNDFLSSFEKYKMDYGYEFLFVNNRGEIVLSSRADLLPAASKTPDSPIGISDIIDLDWFEEFSTETQGKTEPSLVVSSTEGDLLVSKFTIETLNWSLYLLSPLNARQNELNQSFAIYIGLAMLFVLFLYKVMYRIFDYYSNKLSRELNYDPLTKLANRHYAKLHYSRCRKRHRELVLIFIELDDFTQIKDSFGQDAADELLKTTAQCINENIRSEDIAVRWSEQQFMIILSNIDQGSALDIAEKCRTKIAENKITVAKSLIQNFPRVGLVYSRNLSDSFSLMVEWAEQEVRKAKIASKNHVVCR